MSTENVFRTRSLSLLYAGTIFLGAFLLFQVQPLIGKMILPWYGGAASVWTTCLLFFQGLLLLGYLYVHWTTRLLTRKAQGVVHLMLLCSSLALLPLAPRAGWRPSGVEDPALLILGLLSASIGLPYFVLSTTGPLVQAWFARERPESLPYWLFALSNFGSMLALVSYPVFIEPWFALRLQSTGWSSAYVAFAFIFGALAWRGLRTDRTLDKSLPEGSVGAPGMRSLLTWTALAFCPSILLMATTSHLTQDVAPIPLLWVLPLCLYLLSFILCFATRALYGRRYFVPLLVLSLAGMSYGNVADIADAGAWPIIALNCSGLFCSCMVCHGELAKLKPLPSHLTIFYLMISVGGALGGAFVAILAPRLFNGNYELPIGMSATAVIIVSVLYHDPACRLHRIRGRVAWLVMMCLTAAMISTLAYGAATLIGESRVMARNFYGTLRTAEDGDGEDLSRALYHGGTLHGAQYLASDRRRWPTSYYGERTGIGSAILSNRTDLPQRVGVIGLGAGTLAAYGRPNDFYRIYEINGLVLQLARSEFSFLADSRATVEVTIGDARLSLEREQPQGFDVLAVDAFSGDSIPVHLLTRQAFELYFRHLKPGGILAVHVSNRYLDLTPVVKLAADHYSMAARLIDSDEDTDKGVGEATWILVTDRPEVFKRSEFGDATNEIQLKSTIRPWTDDYSSVFAIMK